MERLEKDQKIFNFITNTEHFVESVETHENIEVVFTTDGYCYPVNQIIEVDSNLVAYFFEKILSKKNLTIDEEKILSKKLSSVIPDYCDIVSFNKKLDELNKKNLSSPQLVSRSSFWSTVNLGPILSFFR